ncbi:MAG: acetyltransferase [Bacteroidota bacterium]
MENPVIILGAGPIGRSARDIFEANGNVVYGYLDDDKKLHGTEIGEISVLGATDDDGFLKLIGKKCEAFVAVDDNRLRKSLVRMLNEVRHVQPVNAIHPRAGISPRASMGHGNFVDAGSEIGAEVRLGSHCLVHAGSLIGTGTTLGDNVQIGSGSVISSMVEIDQDVFIGAGVTVVSGIKLGKGCRVGAGSVVIADVKPGETVFGNPAAPVKG